ncbi:Autophagy protein 7, partial [Irineochytrium annulatum]
MLQFEPFASAVDATFWHVLGTKKVDAFRLDDSEKQLHAYYVAGGGSSRTANAPPLPSRLCLGANAFDGDNPPFTFLCNGLIKNTNTIEEFKSLDKQAILSAAAARIWDAIVDGSATKDPSLLTRFHLITFADLKKFKFYYWFAFPALLPKDVFKALPEQEPKPIAEAWNADDMNSLAVEYAKFRDAEAATQAPFFLIKRAEAPGSVKVAKLSDWDAFWAGVDAGKRTVGFADPSSLRTNPGWPLRNFLVYLRKALGVKSVTVVCYREVAGKGDISPSIVLGVDLAGEELDSVPKAVGWEKNPAGKLGPRLADLAPLMDPKRLADTAVDLNLKLMRWRILPDLQLEK